MPSRERPLQFGHIDAFISSLELYVEKGVLVELDHFLPEHWSFTLDGSTVVVAGPDGRDWLPQVGKLIFALGYTKGSVHRERDDGSIELVSWRSDGRAFRIVFVRCAV